MTLHFVSEDAFASRVQIPFFQQAYNYNNKGAYRLHVSRGRSIQLRCRLLPLTVPLDPERSDPSYGSDLLAMLEPEDCEIGICRP